MNTAFELGVVFLLLLLNGLFSMSEMAVISARKGRLQQLANQGSKGAAAALELAGNPGTFLSTVQVGITLVGIVAGAFGGATLSEELTPHLAEIEWMRPHAETYSFALVVAVITYFSLVVGELIPKRIALHSAEAVAVVVARPMTMLATLVSPLVKVLEGSTNAMMRIFGLMDKTDPPITEEEIKLLVEQGTRAGVFETAERDVIHRALQLTDRRISELMVPRTSMVWLDLDDPEEKAIETIRESRHSRYPVAQGSPDNVVGILRAKDALNYLLSGKRLELEHVLLSPLFVPESMPAFRVLEVFRESGRQLALVADEYGGVEGLVTVSDILQALVGDLRSIDHADDPMVVQREDGSWLIDASLGFSDLRRTLSIPEVSQESQTYDTVAGFIMHHLEKIPQISDHFEWKGFRFEVMDMDRHRIDRVLVSRLPPKE
jgi:putative hemolysin